MKPIAQLVGELRKAGVQLWAEAEQLRYRAPHGVLTHEMLAELRGRKAGIVAFLGRGQAEGEALPLGPAPPGSSQEIALAQQRLWLLDRLEGPNATYNIPLALRLKGGVDLHALRQSLCGIVERHESLRTVFETRDEAVCPVVAADCPLPWSVVDLRHLLPARRLPEARDRAHAEASRPFDLGRAPLVRFTLWRLDDRDHVFMMTLHHIAGDGRSIEVLAEDLASFYNACVAGRAPDLPGLPIRYADFAWHQRRWLTGAVMEQQADYWRTQLTGVPPLLELPSDRPRPPLYDPTGACLHVRLPDRLSDGLRQLARRSGVTLYTALLAGLGAFLARYTRRECIPIACPATHRNRPELDRLVGFFVNTLVLRLDLSGNPSFRELLGRARAVITDAFAHQDLPFDKVVEATGVERNPSYPALAQVSLAMLDADKARPRLDGLETEAFMLSNAPARYDLSLEAHVSGAAIDVFWIYGTALFDADTMARMARHMGNLLQAAVEDPDRGLAELRLLDEHERDLLTRGWNSTDAEPPPVPFVHRVFEAWADRAPDAVAVAEAGEALSYGGLNARANRLAHRLMALGVAPDMPVGVCLGRSADMVVALLAVLKAGGGYLALDPALPTERLRFMLRDSGARLLLADRSLAADGLTVIRLDADAESALDGAASNPAVPLGPQDLAYVIYTSGSTGEPKGCEIEHRNLMHYLAWANGHYFAGSGGGSFGLFTSLAFDLTVTSLFLPLIRGETVRVFADDMPLDAVLQAYLSPSSGLDSIKLTPAHIGLLPSLGLTGTRVKLAIVGGEQLLPEQVAVLKKLNPDMRVFNEYGPTEATVGCVVEEVPEGAQRVLIGRPISNTRIYLLDQHMQPVPVGVPGELYIAGHGLARGYLNRPALTAERFVPDPFGVGRLYGSGDLAQWLPSGELECLGRTDHQIKLRGFRIELGEIEAVLGRHPDVQQAAVLAADGPARGMRLIAHVGGTRLPLPAVLKEFLAGRLPDYMVPAIFVVRDRLPFTTNGKIDRGALAAMGPEADDGGAAKAPPRTSLETTLAAIWAELLGLDEIGVHDDFFELGGDSILVLLAVGRANQAGLRLSPRQLLQHPTVAGLAAVAQPVDVGSSLAGPMPLTPIQYWFFEQDLPEPQHFNRSMLLECREPLDPALLVQCVQRLASHHDALRMCFRRTEDGAWRQQAADPDEAVPVAFHDISGLALAQRNAAVAARAAELQGCLSLDGGLVGAAYFDGGAGHPSYFLLAVHRLVVDRTSWRILLEDLCTAYQQMQIGQPVQLPPKTTSVRRWAERLEEYARSDALLAEQDFWLAAPDAALLHLPVDWAEGENNRGSVRHVAVELPEDETRALLQEVPSVYRTRINDVLLTALALALGHWTGRGTLPVDLEVHGREDLFSDIDLSRTVGWFTTFAPVLLRLKTGEGCGAALLRVKEQLRGIPNGGLGYGVLRYLSGDATLARRLRERPQAELCFNYFGQLDRLWPDAAPFRPSNLHAGPQANPNGRRRYLIEVDGEVAAGRLRMRWQYSANRHRAETVENVAAGFLAALRELIDHCRHPEAGAASASDFPLARFDRDQFSKVAKLLAAAKPRSVAP